MRTLKKALSLVLVLAMVLSLGVSAFAVDKASQFSDYGTVTNKEAVDVLTAIGVINGNTDGTFGPSGNFTRAQAATMISYLTLGKTVANALPTGATQFNDVPATHWAAKYVQYCANEGIINGYGDGKFGPDDKLTANQWALMLLGALGYKAANENIGGAGWEIQVTKLAMQAGVASADELVATFNRDMAAKMALNTLKADVVEYTGGSNITINGAVINQGATRKTVTTKDANGKNIVAEAGPDYTVQFAEQHFPNLSISTSSTTDAMGRPAAVWELKGQTSPISTGAAAATLTYTTKVKDADMEKALKGYTYDKANLKATVNGAEGAALTADAEFAKLTGNGKIVEIFADSEKKITNVVVTNPTFGQVTVASRNETKSTGAYTQYTVGGTAYRVFSTVVNEAKDLTKAVISGSVENKDYVLYYVDSEGVAHIEAVDTLTGTLTAVSSTGALTIDGTTYTKAVYGKAVVPSKDAQTFYVDSYGYIIEATEAVDNSKSAMVISRDDTVVLEDGKLKHNYTVDVVETDGTVSTLTLADDTAYGAAEAKIGTAVTYTTNSKGVSTLGAALTEKVTSITNKSAVLGTTTLKANANTKFFFVDWTKDENGKSVVAGTVTAFTGTTAVPTYASLSTAYAVDTNNDKVADVVFVYDNKSATVDDTYIYVVGTYSETADGLSVPVIIKGEDETLTVNNTDENKAKINAGLYSAFTVEDGNITANNKASGAVTWVKNNGGLYYTSADGEEWTYGDASIANDVPVYTIVDGSCTVTTADGLSDGVEGSEIYAVLNDGNTAVVAIYVINK